VAVVASQGPGIYVLMSSLEFPLYGPGWDVFFYPFPESQPISDALASIEGSYNQVCQYEASYTDSGWKCFGVDVPSWVNEITNLEFDSYWVYVTEPITMHLSGGTNSIQNIHTPPATYYGTVLSGPGFTPTAGMQVTAWIEGNHCGHGETLEANGQIVYVIHVLADNIEDTSRCGVDGRWIAFQVESRMMSRYVIWNNTQMWNLPLSQPRIYLPLVDN
jgi:hypothetical protein